MIQVNFKFYLALIILKTYCYQCFNIKITTAKLIKINRYINNRSSKLHYERHYIIRNFVLIFCLLLGNNMTFYLTYTFLSIRSNSFSQSLFTLFLIT